MNRKIALLTVALVAGPAAAADVGVSINVAQPGLYGRLDIGGYPPPQTIYAQPVVIQPAPQYVQEPPLYLHVPPGHAKKWKRYCGRYDACGRPVYFVRDDWYQAVYAPRYREVHGRPDDRRDGGYRDDRERDDRGDDRREDHRKGKGKGKDKEHGHGGDR